MGCGSTKPSVRKAAIFGNPCSGEPCRPFTQNVNIERPPACSVSKNDTQTRSPLPIWEISASWAPAQCKVVGDWDQAKADWVWKVLRFEMMELYTGREQMIFGCLLDDTHFCMLNSVGRLFVIEKKGGCCSSRKPGWLSTSHVLHMKKVKIALGAGAGVVALTIELSPDVLKDAPEILPPITEGTKAYKPTDSQIIEMKSDHAQALVGALIALRLLFCSPPLEVDKSAAPAGFNVAVVLPSPPPDGGLCTIFLAVCSALFVPMEGLSVGEELLTSLPMLELNVSGLSAGEKVLPSGVVRHIGYAVAMAMRWTTRYGGLTCHRNQPNQFWQQVLPVISNGKLLKLDFSGAALDENSVKTLITNMVASGANSIMDLDLSGANFGSPSNKELVGSLARALELTSGGFQRVLLRDCRLTGSVVEPLLRALGGKKAKNLRCLCLAGNPIGKIDSIPHPLVGIWKSNKIEVLDLSGTQLELYKIVDVSALENPTVISAKLLREVKIGGMSLAPKPGAWIGGPVDSFLSSLGASLEVVEAGESLLTIEGVAVFLEALGRTPSPKLSVNLSGVQHALLGIASAATKGRLPGNSLVVDVSEPFQNPSGRKGSEVLADKWLQIENIIANGFMQLRANAPQDKIQLTVQVPEGASACSLVQLQHEGLNIQVAVPAGVAPGQHFQCAVPSNRDAGTDPPKPVDNQRKILASAISKAAEMEEETHVKELRDAGKAASGEVAKLQKLVVAGSLHNIQLGARLDIEALPPESIRSFNVARGGAGPKLAILLEAFSDSKDLLTLDIQNNAGGDVVALMLGCTVLRSNRSIRSLRVEGNYFSHNGWAAIRGAFYGNKKVVDFPFPEQDAILRIKIYEMEQTRGEQYVIECRARIKRAFKSTKGARTPYVMQTLDAEVKNITARKIQMAKMRSAVKKFKDLQVAIQAAIQRNQADEKNKEKFQKENDKIKQQIAKETAKASSKETALREDAKQVLSFKATAIWAERAAVLDLWNKKRLDLGKKHKETEWYDTWKKKVSGVGKPVLNQQNAELLLAMLPESTKPACKTEVSRTEKLISSELDVQAEQDIYLSRIQDQKIQRASAVEPTTRATCVEPPAGIVAPVMVSNSSKNPLPQVQNARYEQFRVYQAQQEQQQRRYAYAAAGAGGAVGFAGAYMASTCYWERQRRLREEEERRRRENDSYYYGGYGYYGYGYYGYYGHSSHSHIHHHDHGAVHDQNWDYEEYDQDHSVDYCGNDNGLVYDQGEGGWDAGGRVDMIEEPLDHGDGTVGSTDVADAAEAVDMYAGGEDERLGGSPPGPGSSELCTHFRPTPPRSDLVEWFDAKIAGAELAARETVLGRRGPLPCKQEVIIQTRVDRNSSRAGRVCLVTQCSIDRIPRLEAQLKAWGGDFSAAVFVDASPGSLAAAEARRNLMQACSRAAAFKAQSNPESAAPEWSIVVVYQLHKDSVRCHAYDSLYPVNTLRNAALARARSEFVFLLDVDFVPSRGLHARLCGEPGYEGNLDLNAQKASSLEGLANSQVALVVPAFEVCKPGGALPLDEESLLAAPDAVEGFHITAFPKGHRATNFARWFGGEGAVAIDEGYAVGPSQVTGCLKTYGIHYEEHFEPYVVVSRRLVPSYDERFRGYGLNKISHLYEMAARGFKFHVVDHLDAFVVAGKHPRSESWKKMYGPDADAEHRARLATHYADFKAELRSRGFVPNLAKDAIGKEVMRGLLPEQPPLQGSSVPPARLVPELASSLPFEAATALVLVTTTAALAETLALRSGQLVCAAAGQSDRQLVKGSI